VATVNLGASDSITASANTGSAQLPLALKICQTDPASGACLSTQAVSATTTIGPILTPTFGIFGSVTGSIPLDPANSRIFVSDSAGVVRGSTSVAVAT
jgi:hypothetical protein